MKTSPYLNIKRIEIVVTNRCNGQCLHCSAAENSHMLSRACIDANETAKVIQTLTQMFRVQSVMTFGGEPLLFPAAACTVHRAATDSGVPVRQVITNGCFAKDSAYLAKTAKQLQAAGVNEILLSVDAFHQKTLPLARVHTFAKSAKACGIPNICLHPAWVVERTHPNEYNRQTEQLLRAFSDLSLPVTQGNNIFLEGRAKKALASYYPKTQPAANAPCGTQPYTEPLDKVQTLSLTPQGEVMVCAFVIGNFYREDVKTILSRYDPYRDRFMRALLTGGAAALVKEAQKDGIFVPPGAQSTCALCRAVNRKRRDFVL